MAIVELAGDIRVRMGRGGSNEVRREGDIPAILYGKGEKPMPIKINARVFDTLVRTQGGIHSVIDLKLPEHSKVMALIREIQRDPVSRDIVHVDFLHISMDKPVQMTVPIVLVGMATGVKEGGILEHLTREIDVKCLPRDIPTSVEVNVEELDIGMSVHVRDLDMGNVEVLTEEDRTITIVVAPTVLAAADEGEEAEGEEAEGEEAEGEGEKEEGDDKGGDDKGAEGEK